MDINFSIMVFEANFWPLYVPDSRFNVPADILPLYNRFSEYHRREQPGRKLAWLWNYSRNEIRTNYLNREYTLVTSSYQMAIMLQYNDHDTLTLDELATATAIDERALKRALRRLVNGDVLIKKEKDRYDLNFGNLFPFISRIMQLSRSHRFPVE